MPRSLRKLLKSAAFLSVGTVLAAENVEVRRGLREFQIAAEKQGAQLSEQEAKVEFAEAREDFARSYAFPSGTLDLFAAPAPGAHGNPLNGRTDWGHWGPVYGARAELTQPLYTFGALSSGREAARQGTAAEKALLEKARWQLRSDVAEYYYGFQLAFDLSELAGDLRSKLEDAIKTVEEGRGRRKASSAQDLDKLRVYLAEVQVREAEARKGQRLAKAAMAWKLQAAGGGESLRWDHANLQLRSFTLKELPAYEQQAQTSRPEFAALKADVAAKEALANVQSGLLLPAFVLGARASWTRAPERETQVSPFANDPLNETSGAVFLGLRWNLNFFQKSAELSQARAELAQAQARERHYTVALRTEIEKNYLDLKAAIEAVSLREGASKAARRVFTDNAVAYNLGSGSAKDLLEALGNFALAEKARFESLYNQNLAIARFEQSVGSEL